MGSLQQFDAHKAIFTSRLLKVWEKAPELSFAELLTRSSAVDLAHRHASDDEIIEALERWILLTPA
jgi:hypothetical protein